MQPLYTRKRIPLYFRRYQVVLKHVNQPTHLLIIRYDHWRFTSTSTDNDCQVTFFLFYFHLRRIYGFYIGENPTMLVLQVTEYQPRLVQSLVVLFLSNLIRSNQQLTQFIISKGDREGETCSFGGTILIA